MMLGDLMTIVQYQLPVKIIVFNNRSLGMVKLEMEVAGIPDLETDKSENLKEKYYGSTFERIDSGTIVCKPDTLSFTLHDYS
jgi:thiamine pyrophosphate-dependent acetolactate synthase large subunit-like protein